MIGTVVRAASVGDVLPAGSPVVVLESMKMEHPVTAPVDCRVDSLTVSVGDQVAAGHTLGSVIEVQVDAQVETSSSGDGSVSAALEEVLERRSFGLDESRDVAVAKRHATGRRTARENIDDLLDDGTFLEYGPLVLAAQRARRSKDELIRKTPGDGLVGGIGEIDGVRCAVMTYDYMVLAGTQGHQNHRKKDRLFEVAERLSLPIIVFAEGGGGRPGETDGVVVAGLDCLAFLLLGRLRLTVPVIGINTGYCFAGNAALFGTCDVRISTENSYVGMAGPAMIEGGGLGVVPPTEIGPITDQTTNGVIDMVVADDAAAVDAAREVLRSLTGVHEPDPARPDAELLLTAVPENRREVYDMRALVGGAVDVGSFIELRPDYGTSVITGLARIDGKPLVVIASDPKHLGGAIDTDAARGLKRMLELAEKLSLPVAFFCDTPGFMVGPDVERTGLVVAAGDLFVGGAALTVPYVTIVTRKGYGLGAQALAGGSFKAPIATVGWPTSEFGGMGLEGFVKLGYRDELAAIEDPDEREAHYESMVAKMYEVGKGLSMADHFEIDDVIDPRETIDWLRLLFR